MAIVQAPWKIDVTYMDREGNKSTVTMYKGINIPFVDVTTEAQAFVTAIGNLTDAVYVGHTVSQNFTEKNPAQAPEVSDVERKGEFSFRLSDGRMLKISVPSIKGEFVVDGTNVIDRGAAAVLAFLTVIVAAATDRVGNDITQFLRALKVHIKSRKG